MSKERLIDEYLAVYFRFYPVQATARGYPGLDDAVPSFDLESVSTLRRAVGRFREALADVSEPRQGTDDHLDFRSLRDELTMALFFIDDLKWLERNPLTYVETALDGVEGLDLRQDLSPKARARCQARRLEGIASLMGQLERQVTEPAEPYLEAALDMLEGGVAGLAERFAGRQTPQDLRKASDRARRALDGAFNHLERRRGEARPFEAMGEERYCWLLEQEHHLDRPLETLKRLAEATLARVEEDLPGVIAQEDALDMPEPSPSFGKQDVLAYYRSEIDAMKAAVVERGLVTIPPGTLELRETPEYQLALLPGASYQPPPAFAAVPHGYFFVRPVPERMTRKIRRGYHRQVFLRSFRNLVIHEVYPGHHVQFLHAARHHSRIRKIRDNDLLVEGWALYCEQMMHDEGLFDELPSSRPLRALRMRAIRVIVDIALHTGRLTPAQVADFMCDHFGEDARGWIEMEVRRYAAEPTQALSYLIGRELVFELREEFREAVGPRRFTLRDFHDRFLSEGSIPIALVREKLLAGARAS
ncbi:MAG: DUF885 domain-containing protein [Rhodospirillales bacterium]|nr:DUF885 domain-containing protein [Rhodospirillales bacterium]